MRFYEMRFSRGVSILDFAWHYVLHCPLFKDLLVRSSKLRDIETGSELIESPRPSVALKILLSSCAKEPARIQPLVSFVQLSLKLRERWLQDNVVGGLQLTPAVQVGLPRSAVVLYDGSVHTWCCYQHLASPHRFSRSAPQLQVDTG